LALANEVQLMADEVQESTPADDFAVGVEDGEISPVAALDALPTFQDALTTDDVAAEAQAWLTSVTAEVAPDVVTAMQETLDPLTDAVNDGIVPPSQAKYFFFWLAYSAGVTLIPAAGIYAFVQGYVVKWAQGNGWATEGPNPQPTPQVQQVIESANAAQPLPGAVTVPQDLPSPTKGQQAVVTGTTGVTPSTVTGGTQEGTSAEQVSAALAVTAVDILRVVAKVFDGMLPNMAPGQVPEALGQLNTAVNALEAQMQQVRNGQWPRGFVGLQEAVNGGLQALNGLEQEVGILAQDVAMKAESAIGDDVNANTKAIAGVTATVAGIAGTTIPVLEGQLGSLTGTVNQLGDTVTNTVEPELAQVTADTAANTKMLSGTDQDCLDQLCDAEGNVIKPITDGGATPSLLSKLGSLLGLGWALGSLFGLMDVIETLFDAPLALQAVATDVEQLSSWASSAAAAIEADLPFAPST
jgi:hypothetical protein